MDKIAIMIWLLAASFFFAFFGILILVSEDFATTISLSLFSKRLFFGMALLLCAMYTFFLSMRLKLKIYQEQNKNNVINNENN